MSTSTALGLFSAVSPVTYSATSGIIGFTNPGYIENICGQNLSCANNDAGFICNISGQLLSTATNDAGFITAASTSAAYVPYTGATGDINLGNNSLCTSCNICAAEFYGNGPNLTGISAGMSTSTVLGLFSGTSPITYSTSTGAIGFNNPGYITLGSLSGTAPISYNATTGAISISQASSTANGYLSSTDWNTFNNKLSTTTAASTYVPYTGATGAVNLGAIQLLYHWHIIGRNLHYFRQSVCRRRYKFE